MRSRYFILLAIIATTTLYIYLDKDLQTKLKEKIHLVAPELNQSTLYKWQNTKGEWQVTDKPPSKGTAFTIVKTQDQINIMPSSTSKKSK